MNHHTPMAKHHTVMLEDDPLSLQYIISPFIKVLSILNTIAYATCIAPINIKDFLTNIVSVSSLQGYSTARACSTISKKQQNVHICIICHVSMIHVLVHPVLYILTESPVYFNFPLYMYYHLEILFSSYSTLLPTFIVSSPSLLASRTLLSRYQYQHCH